MRACIRAMIFTLLAAFAKIFRLRGDGNGRKAWIGLRTRFRRRLISTASLLLVALLGAGVLATPASAYEVDSRIYRMADNAQWAWNGGAPASQRCGSRALITMLYDVAARWYAAHDKNKLKIWDLNAPGHSSHKRGVDVDLSTVNGRVADMRNKKTYDQAGTIQLGKFFVDTGIVTTIFFNDAKAREEINKYAGKPIAQYWKGHEDHFHVRIAPQFRVATSTSCPAGAPTLNPTQQRTYADMALTKDGRGYLLVSSQGEVYVPQDRPGNTVRYWGNPRIPAGTSVTGVSVTADGQGYILTTDKGHVYAYGTVRYWDNPPIPAGTSVTGVSTTGKGQGYILNTNRGHVYAYGSAIYRGNGDVS